MNDSIIDLTDSPPPPRRLISHRHQAVPPPMAADLDASIIFMGELNSGNRENPFRMPWVPHVPNSHAHTSRTDATGNIGPVQGKRVNLLPKAAPKPPVRPKQKSPEPVMECPICIRTCAEIRKANEKLMTTPCGHLFCKKCLDESLRHSYRCAKCRQPVMKQKCITIFF